MYGQHWPTVGDQSSGKNVELTTQHGCADGSCVFYGSMGCSRQNISLQRENNNATSSRQLLRYHTCKLSSMLLNLPHWSLLTLRCAAHCTVSSNPACMRHLGSCLLLHQKPHTSAHRKYRPVIVSEFTQQDGRHARTVHQIWHLVIVICGLIRPLVDWWHAVLARLHKESLMDTQLAALL